MGEQKSLHTYLYSFFTGDICNLFVFLWSSFTYLGLDDWDKTKKEWSRVVGRKEERASPWGQKGQRQEEIGQRVYELHPATLNLCTYHCQHLYLQVARAHCAGMV